MSTDYTVAGFDAIGIASGVKEGGKLDLAIIASRVPCQAAATFTQSAFAAAPVSYDKRLLAFNSEQVHGVIVNSGNANACTGIEGDANARLMAERTEQELGAHENSVFVMSTGVIGEQLPMTPILDGVPKAVQQLHPDGWEAAAQAIMTTDTVHKLATRTAFLSSQSCKLTGISKGSGMIHPNMATMLGTIVTDVHIAQPLLQQALEVAIGRSFNRISIDGDTSTNDTVLILANGLAGNDEITDVESADFAAFREVLTDICVELAQAIVRDGEGATKFITIQVNGGTDDADAHLAANTIAISPLCKTAFYGGDANWGRFVMALGRSGAQMSQKACSIFIRGGADVTARGDELQLLADGQPTGYTEGDAAAIFAQSEIDVRVELAQGDGSATIWTCDLSHEYVTINADYRT